MKKLLSFILLFLCILLVSGCTKNSSNHIIDISLEELKTKIENKDSFALFIGNDNCSHCVSYKPILEGVLNDYDITIYHLDNSKLSSDEYNEFKGIINISGTPTIVFLEDGEEETTLNRIVGESTRQRTIERFKTNGYIK